MYEIFECEKPACIEGFPNLTKECWDSNKFKTLEEAQEYVRAWLGQYADAHDVELVVDEPFYFGGENDYVVIHYVEDMPKILQKELDDIDTKRERLLKAEGIARILETVAAAVGQDAYPEIYYNWTGYRGKLQVNGIKNMKTEIPPIIAEFAKFGYRVKKWEDSAQSNLRTYYLCLREDESVQDIYISAHLDQQQAQCRYVKVGSHTTEVIDYELRCKDAAIDTPEPQPQPESGEIVESNNDGGEQREPESSEPSGTECGDSSDSANLSEGLQSDCSPEGAAEEVDAEGSVEPEEK